VHTSQYQVEGPCGGVLAGSLEARRVERGPGRGTWGHGAIRGPSIPGAHRRVLKRNGGEGRGRKVVKNGNLVARPDPLLPLPYQMAIKEE